MARGKIEIKRIENMTNRQVTFSKRRNGLFKKAHELTVLCDAKVSILMVSSSNKLHEYISPNVTTKEMLDEYQRTKETDLWSTHYERMQENLRKLKEVNQKLRLEVRRRLGESLGGMTFEELCGLEQEMENSAREIRERKNKLITGQIGTSKKKVKNQEQIQKNLRYQLNMSEEEMMCEFDEMNRAHYESIVGYLNGGSRVFALSLQPNLQPNQQPSIQSGGESELTFTFLQ